MKLKLIGYFPKKRIPMPKSFTPTTIISICSVSECIVPGPENWIEHWKHNDLSLFDTPRQAQSVIPTDSSDIYDIREYRAYPILVGQKAVKPWDLHIVSPTPIDDRNLKILGYDLVSISFRSNFECSPLSCNGLGNEWPVNKYCLIDDADVALDLVEKLLDENAEPGPYCVIRVANVI